MMFSKKKKGTSFWYHWAKISQLSLLNYLFSNNKLLVAIKEPGKQLAEHKSVVNTIVLQ